MGTVTTSSSSLSHPIFTTQNPIHQNQFHFKLSPTPSSKSTLFTAISSPSSSFSIKPQIEIEIETKFDPLMPVCYLDKRASSTYMLRRFWGLMWWFVWWDRNENGFPVVPGTWFIGSKLNLIKALSGSSLLPGISFFSKSAHQKNKVAQRGRTDFISNKLDGDTAATEDR